MKCIAIEDEVSARKLIEAYIQRTPSFFLVATYSSVSEVPLGLIDEIDLLIIGIELPELSGIDFLKTLQKKPKVIITTAYRDYAVEAFEVAVDDYLLKPFSYERFLQSLYRLQKSNNNSKEGFSSQDNSFFVYVDRSYLKINPLEINYIKAEVDYVMLYMENKKVLIKDSLNNWEEKLNSVGFIRIHRSFLIRKEAISKIQGNMVYVNDEHLPIGKTYKDEVLRKLGLG